MYEFSIWGRDFVSVVRIMEVILAKNVWAFSRDQWTVRIREVSVRRGWTVHVVENSREILSVTVQDLTDSKCIIFFIHDQLHVIFIYKCRLSFFFTRNSLAEFNTSVDAFLTTSNIAIIYNWIKNKYKTEILQNLKFICILLANATCTFKK